MGHFEIVTNDNRADAFAVRRAVFIEEQGYENEYDAIDDAPDCIHVTLLVDGKPAACARTFSQATELACGEHAHELPASPCDADATPESAYILGRVAVLEEFRRQGLASEVVKAAEGVARAAGAVCIKLHAQEYVRNLYGNLGYEQISDIDYEDEGQPHLWMAKRL